MTFKCLQMSVLYLDVTEERQLRLHGLMYCRFCFTLGWLSEIVLLCFGWMVLDIVVLDGTGYIGCVSESGDFKTLFFLIRQHWSGCRYTQFAANFKAF